MHALCAMVIGSILTYLNALSPNPCPPKPQHPIDYSGPEEQFGESSRLVRFDKIYLSLRCLFPSSPEP